MKIITYPNKILSQKAEPVQVEEIAGLKSVIADMVYIMRLHRGLGLSAPQVGLSKRIIVWIDGGVNMALINPVTIHSHGKIKIKEGCLSLPGIQREIKRKRVIVVKGLSIIGEPMEMELKNMDAVIIQHEIDHLNGITILDSAKKRNKYGKI